MSLVSPLIKCTIAERVDNFSIDFVEYANYVITNGKLEYRNAPDFLLFRAKNNKYKTLNYNGYISGRSTIIMTDKSDMVLKQIIAEGNSYINTITFSIPDGCYYIYYFCIPAYGTRFSFVAFSTPQYDVTPYISDWESLEIIMERDKTSGVIPDISFPINLVLGGKEFVKDIFNRKGLRGKAVFDIYKRGDFNNTYTLLKSMDLDFGTYKEYDNKVTITSVKGDLMELINSQGKTKYEIPVSELCESKKWKYERMNFINNAIYEVNDKEVPIPRSTKNVLSLPLYLSGSEIVPGVEVDFKGQILAPENGQYFFTSYLPEVISLNLELNANISIYGVFGKTSPGASEEGFLTLKINKYNNNGEVLSSIQSVMLTTTQHKHLSDFLWEGTYQGGINETIVAEIGQNEHLGICVTIDRERYIEDGHFKYIDASPIKAYFKKRSVNYKDIEVIKPEILIQKYLDKMCGWPGTYHAQIEWDNTTDFEDGFKPMIVAAESIRQIEGAKIYGSPNDFFDWMNVLGYEYDIDGFNLTFKRRDEYFDKNTTAMTLRADELADLIVQADETYAYTSIEIGYEKQDYDTINGRCEANGTFAYTTGYNTRVDNKLSLISPYRADSVGIEILCQEADKQTTDNKSDNDIFFVAMTEQKDYYAEYRGKVIKDINWNLEMFNAPYIPTFLARRNASLIGIISANIYFKATNMSRTAEVKTPDGGTYKLYDNIWFGFEKLFEPVKYNFATGSTKDLPPYSLRNGVIKFEWEDKILKGFINQVRKNYAAETETTWTLWAVMDNI